MFLVYAPFSDFSGEFCYFSFKIFITIFKFLFSISNLLPRLIRSHYVSHNFCFFSYKMCIIFKVQVIILYKTIIVK